MNLRAVPLVVRSAAIVIACVMLVQLLNLAVFVACPPVPLDDAARADGRRSGPRRRDS